MVHLSCCHCSLALAAKDALGLWLGLADGAQHREGVTPVQDMLSSGDSMQGNPIWSCLAHVCYGHGTEPAALSWFLPWIKVMSWQCVQTGRNVQERWLRVMSNNPCHVE